MLAMTRPGGPRGGEEALLVWGWHWHLQSTVYTLHSTSVLLSNSVSNAVKSKIDTAYTRILIPESEVVHFAFFDMYLESARFYAEVSDSVLRTP